jgi:hypothetical protein
MLQNGVELENVDREGGMRSGVAKICNATRRIVPARRSFLRCGSYAIPCNGVCCSSVVGENGFNILRMSLMPQVNAVGLTSRLHQHPPCSCRDREELDPRKS